MKFLEAEEYLHQDQFLKKKPILCKKFPDGNKSFKATESWLHKWEIFYDIGQQNVNGNKLSADEV